MTRDRWYFAYGSNLLPDQKQRRTGTIREVKRCRLLGWRLAFNKRGNDGAFYANIVGHETEEVWGVIYRCNPHALSQMDDYEGVCGGHYCRVAGRQIHDDLTGTCVRQGG
jgi:gamma-glutamylcyclotransferase